VQFLDIVARVASKCDDPEQTVVDTNYVLGFAQDVYEWLFNKLILTGAEFATQVVVLPAVTAGSPDLNAFQASGQPLATLIQPRIIRWRVPGQDATFWRRADGPLDYIRDMPSVGIPQLDSWAWMRYSIKLSTFSTALDIEVTGEFLFDPLTAPDSQIQIAQNSNRCFSCKLASEVGKARGNKDWIKIYGDDADEAFDDLAIAMTRADQAKTRRLGRISRGTGTQQKLITTK
jgi:hypothetical protein